MQNSIFQAGGLCDRLRGMCGTYKICKELGLEYKIAHLYPFNLYDYLRPNKVDWYIDENDIEWDKRFLKIIYWGPIPLILTMRKTWDEYHDFNFSQFRKKLARVNKQRQVHVYSNLHCIRMEDTKELFHELFKPTEELKEQVEWNKEQIGGSYISVTTRFQNLMGDFYEGKEFGTLDTEEEKKDYINRCMERVEEIHEQNPDKKVLVTSDSARFLEEVNQLPYVHVNPGKLAHIQFTTDASHYVYLKSFVDLLTIAEADKVHLLVTGRMYRSGFPITAAAINGKTCEIIRF